MADDKIISYSQDKSTNNKNNVNIIDYQISFPVRIFGVFGILLEQDLYALFIIYRIHFMRVKMKSMYDFIEFESTNPLCLCIS